MPPQRSRPTESRASPLGALPALPSETNCEFPLRSRWQVLLFLLSLGIPALALAFWTVRWSYADRLASADDLKPVERAAALDPSNPQIREQLGLISLYSVNEGQPARAVGYLKEAIALAPRRSNYWVDLASACDWNKDLDCSDSALEQALKLRPMAPRLEWITANHYVRTGRPALAVPHFHRLLELGTDYAWPTFALCTRIFPNPELILRQVVPPQPDPALKLSLIDFLSQQGRLEYANRVWTEVVAAGVAFPFERAEPYFERLLNAGEIGQAESVWNDLRRLSVIPTPQGQSVDNLVFNGGFEQSPLNAGFDWRAGKIPYVVVDFHDPSGAAAPPSMRVDFTVPRNDEVEAAFQLVPVRPGADYSLRAEVRSLSITSDSGPRLRVQDPGCPACLDAQSDATVGTSSWHPLTLHFTTGNHTRLIRLSVWRPRSRNYPPEISGSFWLDDVSIEQVKGAGLAPLEP
jgi:tetratricopeptide (TPR) repeat protein